MVMDIVVADIPPKFGMLLSRSWTKRMGGTIQMDWSYATIHVFGGEHRRLYREIQMAYVISDQENPTNHPLYAVNEYMGSCILYMSDDAEICIDNVNKSLVRQVEIYKMAYEKCMVHLQKKELV